MGDWACHGRWRNGHRSINSMRLGRTGESVHVDMMQTPAGSIVSHVAFHVSQESMTRDAFKAQVLGKYGNPQRIVAGDDGKWCSPEAAAFCGQALPSGGRYDSDYPMLTTSLMGRALDLTIGEDESRRIDRAGEAAVEALAPKTAHAAF